MTTPALPTYRQLGQAFLIALYTCAMTFFAGLIGQGVDLEHWPDWRIAVQAGISAGLAALGWVAIGASRSNR